MTPKEKAQELVDKFSDIKNVTFSIIRTEVKNNIAKQCALITVDEILKVSKSYAEKDYEYYQQVKEELNKEEQ